LDYELNGQDSVSEQKKRLLSTQSKKVNHKAEKVRELKRRFKEGELLDWIESLVLSNVQVKRSGHVAGDDRLGNLHLSHLSAHLFSLTDLKSGRILCPGRILVDHSLSPLRVRRIDSIFFGHCICPTIPGRKLPTGHFQGLVEFQSSAPSLPGQALIVLQIGEQENHSFGSFLPHFFLITFVGHKKLPIALANYYNVNWLFCKWC